MVTKILRVLVAFCLAAYPFQGMALAAITVDIGAGVGAEGTLGAVSTMTVTLRNVADDSVNITGLGFNAGPGSTLVTSPQYLEMDYNDNRVGDQRIIIRTDNSNGPSDAGTDANPRYFNCNPAATVVRGTGAGLVGTVDCNIDVPLFWVVFPDKVTGGYTFVTDSSGNTRTDIQAFVQDLKADLNGFDTDRNGTRDCAEPDTATRRCIRFDAGYASVAFTLAGNTSAIANFPDDNVPGGGNTGTARTDSNGEIFMYLAADYKGKDAQRYSTNTLEVQLVTVTP